MNSEVRIMYKALFFDIDGTLVSFKTHEIPESAKQALWDLHNKGIKLFIATGRGKDGLGVLEGLPFDGFITLNGQYCFTPKEVLFINTIKKEDISSLLDYIKDKNIPVGFTTDKGKYFNYRDERVDIIHSITHNDNHPAQDCSNVLNENVMQCMVFCSEDEEKELLKVMPHCHPARWHELFADIAPLGGSKQRGMDIFLKYFGISLEETMAFGDGGNDREMLEHAALAVAMGNANEPLKEIADYITDDVEHDGLYKAFKHYQLI